MPSWADLRPADMRRQLPQIWSCRYDTGRGEFYGRLGGEATKPIFGGSLRGLPLSDVHPIARREVLISRLKRVVELPAAVTNSGLIFEDPDSYGIGECITLPLSSDGERPDGVLGATDYVIRNMISDHFSQHREFELVFQFYQKDPSRSG